MILQREKMFIIRKSKYSVFYLIVNLRYRYKEEMNNIFKYCLINNKQKFTNIYLISAFIIIRHVIPNK